jgi:hypothetical protein
MPGVHADCSSGKTETDVKKDDLREEIRGDRGKRAGRMRQ